MREGCGLLSGAGCDHAEQGELRRLRSDGRWAATRCPTTPRPSRRRWKQRSRPTWRSWRWARAPTGWRAKPSSRVHLGFTGGAAEAAGSGGGDRQAGDPGGDGGAAAGAEVGGGACAGHPRGVEPGDGRRTRHRRYSVRRRESFGQAAVEPAARGWAGAAVLRAASDGAPGGGCGPEPNAYRYAVEVRVAVRR